MATQTISKPHSATCRKRVEEKTGVDPRGKETKDRADEKWNQWAARESDKVEEAEKSTSTTPAIGTPRARAPSIGKKPDETQNKSNDSGARVPETMDLGGVQGNAEDTPVPQHEHDEEDLKETRQYKPREAASSSGDRKEFPNDKTENTKKTGASAPVTSVS